MLGYIIIVTLVQYRLGDDLNNVQDGEHKSIRLNQDVGVENESWLID